MNLLQYIELHLDEAIKMLMDDKKTKTECALFLADFKKMLWKPEKEIVDGEFSEIETNCIECK